MEKAEKERKQKISFRFVPTRCIIENYKKIAKKFKKLKIPLWLLFKPKKVGKGREREKKKKIIPISSYATRNRKFQKNSKKIQKIKNTIMASLQAKISWERPRKREKKKKIVPTSSYTTRNRKFQKIKQENSKN